MNVNVDELMEKTAVAGKRRLWIIDQEKNGHLNDGSTRQSDDQTKDD